VDMKHDPVLANQLKSKWEHHRRLAEIYEAAWKAEISELSSNGGGAKKEVAKLFQESEIVSSHSNGHSKRINPKRDWLRATLRQHPNLKPAEIREQAKSEGLVYNRSFPYTSLFRLKAEGKVGEKDGKYFLKEGTK
jgi:hypothetical protein